MMCLFEWGVATDVRGGRRVAPVGVTDKELRAQSRMLEALSAVPEGVTARGWVMLMIYAPGASSYQRFDLLVRADRDANRSLANYNGEFIFSPTLLANTSLSAYQITVWIAAGTAAPPSTSMRNSIRYAVASWNPFRSAASRQPALTLSFPPRKAAG